MYSAKKRFFSINVSNFFSGIADVLFAPIFLNYLVSENYSSWLIATVAILEYTPRLLAPLINRFIIMKSTKTILIVSTCLRVMCYLFITGLFSTLLNEKESSIFVILLIIVLNFISDFFGSVYFLNQTIINKNNVNKEDLGKLSSTLFLTSNLGIFLAYSLAPFLAKIFSTSNIALINSFIFLFPLIQLKFIRDGKIATSREKNKVKLTVTGNKKILFPIFLTFLLNLLIGNPNFIVTIYSQRFHLSTVTAISIFSSLFLLGSILPNIVLSFKKIIINFYFSIAVSYFLLFVLFLTFLFTRNTFSLIIYLLMGISIGIVQPNLNRLLYEKASEDTVSHYFSITSLLNSLGTIISPFLTQTLFSVFGYNLAIFIICSYYMGLTVLASFKFSRE